MSATTATKRWWTRTESYGGRASARLRTFKFGAVRFDGTRDGIEVIEYRGGGALTTGVDKFNPWRNPGPHAYINIQAADATECREAARALIQAAELIEGAV